MNKKWALIVLVHANATFCRPYQRACGLNYLGNELRSDLETFPIDDLNEVRDELLKLKLVISPLATIEASRLVSFTANKISSEIDSIATNREIDPRKRLVFLGKVKKLFMETGLTEIAESFVRDRNSYRFGQAGSPDGRTAVRAKKIIFEILGKVRILSEVF